MKPDEGSRHEMNVSVENDRKLQDETSDSAPDTEVGDDGTDDGSDGAESVAAERRPWRRRLVFAAVAVLIVGGFATSGFLGWQLWQDRQVARAGEQAQAAAVEYAQVLTSIDSARVDENFDRVLDGATGEFKDMYSESSVELRQLLIDNEAAAHGVVVESAVQSATTDEVVVLLFVDQSVSNSSIPDPRIDRSRIKMTMEFVDERWRASKVELP
ncbi:hypothetical protein GCM10027535_04570 [Mycolicibacterium hippocampi]